MSELKWVRYDSDWLLVLGEIVELTEIFEPYELTGSSGEGRKRWTG